MRPSRSPCRGGWTDRRCGLIRSASWSSPGRRCAGQTAIRAIRTRRPPTIRAISSGSSRDREPAGDETLRSLSLLGDERAIRVLVRRYNQRLFRVARSVLRNDAEAEDVVQETYVRAFSGLSGFRGEAQLSTWLTRIALNEALGRLRRRRPTVEFSDAGLREGQVLTVPTMPRESDPEGEAAR